jgi:hypothetical protein
MKALESHTGGRHHCLMALPHVCPNFIFATNAYRRFLCEHTQI